MSSSIAINVSYLGGTDSLDNLQPTILDNLSTEQLFKLFEFRHWSLNEVKSVESLENLIEEELEHYQELNLTKLSNFVEPNFMNVVLKSSDPNLQKKIFSSVCSAFVFQKV